MHVATYSGDQLLFGSLKSGREESYREESRSDESGSNEDIAMVTFDLNDSLLITREANVPIQYIE